MTRNLSLTQARSTLLGLAGELNPHAVGRCGSRDKAGGLFWRSCHGTSMSARWNPWRSTETRP